MKPDSAPGSGRWPGVIYKHRVGLLALAVAALAFSLYALTLAPVQPNDDLAERGLLDSTLVVVMSEFGRTPKINARYGRDHWGTAWSVALGGAGIQPGAVIGKTNKNGTAVAEREVDHSHLFHTYLQAVGVDSTDVFQVGGRPMPIADPRAEAIQELLA